MTHPSLLRPIPPILFDQSLNALAIVRHICHFGQNRHTQRGPLGSMHIITFASLRRELAIYSKIAMLVKIASFEAPHLLRHNMFVKVWRIFANAYISGHISRTHAWRYFFKISQKYEHYDYFCTFFRSFKITLFLFELNLMLLFCFLAGGILLFYYRQLGRSTRGRINEELRQTSKVTFCAFEKSELAGQTG